MVIEKRETFVKRGETGGKKLKNRNIVIEALNILLNKRKGKGTIENPTLFTSEDHLLLISYIQKKDDEITGAKQSEKFRHH